MTQSMKTVAPWSQRVWQGFCRRMTGVFYRHPEVSGLEHLPESGPVLLAANHVNALADAVVVQFASPRPIHPIARSGLFRSAVFRPILKFIQAVPIQRRRPGAPKSDNSQSFARIYEYLDQGRVILIFPEGQSHSDPSLRPLKTGVARMAQGFTQRTGRPVPVVPVGLTFTNKGRFRADVLVQLGPPLVMSKVEGESDEEQVRRFTEEVLAGLKRVTLNVDSWEDLALMRLLQHFFALRSADEEVRHEEAQHLSLTQRFRSLKRLDQAHRALRARWPDRIAILRSKLNRFQRLCRRYGVRNYQLQLRYTPKVVLGFMARSFGFLTTVFPLALWGLLHSALPYAATRWATRASARGRDQYDTAGMLFGLTFFAAFWGAQTLAVAWWWGPWPSAAFYALSLPITAAIALRVGHERQRILEEIRIFFLFSRRKELQRFLRTKREELEVELARMARRARRVQKELDDSIQPSRGLGASDIS